MAAAMLLGSALTVPATAAPAYKKGDINMDGEIGPEDASLALVEYVEYYLAGKPHTLTDEQLALADVDSVSSVRDNWSSGVNLLDANYILIYYTECVADPKLKETDISAWIPDCPVKFVPVEVNTDGSGIYAEMYHAERQRKDG